MRARALLTALAACGLLAGGAGAAEAAKTRVAIEQVRVGSKAAPVVLRVATGRDAELRLKVNGRPAGGEAFYYFGPGTRIAHLAASQGLRPGTNELRVRATGPNGDPVTATANVRLSRADLLADAGDDAETPVGTVSPVGASERGAPNGIRYRWRIAGAPPDADVRLRAPRSAVPELHARTRGTYVLRLRVTRRGKPGSSRDTVTVPVGSDPPVGVPINTILGSGKIQIGGGEHPGGTGGSDIPRDRIVWAVVSRTDREVVDSGTVGRDDAGMATLAKQADTYASGANFRRYLMIVTGRTGVPDAQLAAFGRIAKRIGSPTLSADDFSSLRAGRPFSIIGMPGGEPGAATVRIPPGYTPEVPGAITGYLQQNQAVTAAGAQLYEYVSPEYPLYDTRVSSSATQNTMRVGGTTYADSLPGGGATAGFHVVTFESTTMRQLDRIVVATNGGGIDRERQTEVARQLKEMFDRPGGPLVFLQTVGKPKAAGPEWTGVVDQIARLGGNRHRLFALDGTHEYAIVGRVGAAEPPVEAGTSFDQTPYGVHPSPPPSRLVGNLARARDSKFVPTVATTTSTGVNTDLVQMAYQPATPWPQLAAGQPESERYAAARHIWTELKFCTPPVTCTNAQLMDRGFYWRNWRANWTDLESRLARMTWPGASSGFSQATFDAMKSQLGDEFGRVANVRNYFEALKTPFDQSATRGYVNLQKIGNEIWQSVQRPSGDDGTTAWALKLVSYALKIGEFSPPPGSAAAAGTSAVFGLASFLSEPAGPPVLGDEVKVRAEQLATEMLNRYDRAKEQIVGTGRIIISDYGKLTAADAQVNSAWALPSEAVAAAQIETASKQWFYEALVPVAYPWLIRGDDVAQRMDCQIRTGTGQRRDGWPNQPMSAQMTSTVGYDQAGNPIRNVFWFARGIGGAMSPPGSLGDSVFAPPNNPTEPRGLGMEKLDFFTPTVFDGNVAHALNGQRWCRVSFLPQGW